MNVLSDFDRRIGLKKLLDLMLKVIDFGSNVSIGLLQLLEIWHVVVDVEESHQLIMLRTEFVQLSLYFFDIALHLNLTITAHHISHTTGILSYQKAN